MMPRPIYWLMLVLMPSRILMALSCRWYDPCTAVYTFGKTKVFAFDLDYMLRGTTPPEWMRFVKNENGLLTIEKKDMVSAYVGGDDWKPTTETPPDGESIWIFVREYDGVSRHVDYAVAFYDVDGVHVKRSENDEDETWPPNDVTHWRSVGDILFPYTVNNTR
jgi:hypothetical protein